MSKLDAVRRARRKVERAQAELEEAIAVAGTVHTVRQIATHAGMAVTTVHRILVRMRS